LSRYFSPVRLPSRTYKSNLQSKEKQPRTVTPSPPKCCCPQMKCFVGAKPLHDPRKTTPREDWLIFRRARQRPFSTAGALRGNLAFGGHISTRTVIRRLHHKGMRARRPITRPQLTLRHRHARFDWSHDHLGWTIRTWIRVVEASDYSACANVASKR
jgi:hypothetical protein